MWKMAQFQSSKVERMIDASPQSVAEDIARRHRVREQFTLDLPQGHERDLDFAYAVQANLLPLIAPGGDVRRAGYKIGVTTPPMQKMCGIPSPVAGVVFAHRLHRTPATTRAADHARLGIESEMALRIGKTLPVDASLTADAVIDHISDACAAFELIDDCNADYTRLTGMMLIADNGWNAGLVLGPPQSVRGRRSLAGLRSTLTMNGKNIGTGTSNDVLGDPFNAILWLHRHLVSQGRTLQEGEWVTTGSLIVTQFAVAGQTYVHEVEGFSPVQVTVT